MSDPVIAEYLTLAELCAWLKVPRATVYDWVHKRCIPHVKLGRLLRFERAAIAGWLAERERAPRTRKSYILR